jgi:hypothetical protein
VSAAFFSPTVRRDAGATNAQVTMVQFFSFDDSGIDGIQIVEAWA